MALSVSGNVRLLAIFVSQKIDTIRTAPYHLWLYLEWLELGSPSPNMHARALKWFVGSIKFRLEHGVVSEITDGVTDVYGMQPYV